MTTTKPSKKEDKEFDAALNELNIDKTELDSKEFNSFTPDKEVIDKVTQLKNFVIEYQMNLEGKTYDKERGGYVQTGKALAGSEFIRLSSGILMSFATDANLLSTKTKDTFMMQFKDAHEKVNLSLSMRSRAVPDRTQRAVLKMWKDTFWNICEIIIGSGKNMESVFTGVKQMNGEKQGLKGF